jgi:hypothetical protein
VAKRQRGFDLAAELKADPPASRYGRSSPFNHPRVNEWLDQLLGLKAQGLPVTIPYMAAKLTKACRAEELIRPDAKISASALQKYLARRG